jgi:integrase
MAKTLSNGKRKTKYSKNQKEVKEWLLGQPKAIEDGKWVESDIVTLSAFLDRYIADIAEHTLRPKTIESYEYLIRLNIKPELGNAKLTTLRPDHLQNLYSLELNQGHVFVPSQLLLSHPEI